MSEIATAYVQIEPTFQGVQSKIESEMGGAGTSGGQSFSSGFASVLGGAGGAVATAGKAMAGAVAAGGAALAGLGASFVSGTSSVAAYGDNIDKMSQKMGMSAEAYQEWDAVMQHSGTSMETMKSSMKTLANAAEGGNKAFEALGITQEEIANMSQQDLFEATIAGLQNVEDTTQRTYLAGQLLGRGATELGALLNTSAEDTQAMRDRVRELGGVMSEDAIKSAAAYQDQLQDMKTAFSGLSRNMMSEFLPGMTTVMGGLTEIFAGNSEQGLGMVSEGINSLVTTLTEALPQILSVAGSILQSLGQAILDNAPLILQTGMEVLNTLAQGLLAALPQLVPILLQIITTIGTSLIELLPQLLEVGMQVIVELAMGIAQALPTLIPTMIEVMLNLVSYLLDNIDLLIDAAIQLITGLAIGLINAVPVLIEKAPEIIIKLVTALIQAAPKLLQAAQEIIKTLANAIQTYWPQLLAKIPQLLENLKQSFIKLVTKFVDVGKNIVNGIKDGIANAWDSLVSWFTSKIDGLVEAVANFLGIASPSKVFANEVGQWIPAGIAEGIQSGMKDLDKTVDSMTSDMLDSVNVSGTMDMVTTGDTAIGSLYSLLAEYLPMIARGERVNITLEGDMGRLFKAMQRESIRNTQLVGTGAVLSAT